MATQVKVCGITREEDAELALSLGADYIGINVYPKSPRSVEIDRIKDLFQVIPEGKRVVVDVAPVPDQVEVYKALGFNYFQFHFDLDISMAAIASWSRSVGSSALWLAPRIAPSEQSFPQILMEFAESILLDAFDKEVYGGTGHAGQNWQRFLDCTVLYQHKQWILAGGLSPDNIFEALSFTEASLVDVNSGVEQLPGIKDSLKLKAFFERVREFDQR